MVGDVDNWLEVTFERGALVFIGSGEPAAFLEPREESDNAVHVGVTVLDAGVGVVFLDLVRRKQATRLDAAGEPTLVSNRITIAFLGFQQFDMRRIKQPK